MASPPNKYPKLKLPAAEPAHDVGYAKPPTATRFKPGQSGNPKGRPKGRTSALPALGEQRLKTIIQVEAYRDIKVNDGNGQITMSMAQAVIRSLAVGAAKGQPRSQRLFTDLLMLVEQQNRAQHDAWLEAAIEYKTSWEQELERCKNLGIDAPDPIPHPDDIIIDPLAGTVEIRGPMTKQQKKTWDRLRQRVLDADDAIAAMEQNLTEKKYQKYRNAIEQDIAYERNLRKMIVSKIGEPPEWFKEKIKRGQTE